MAAVRTEGSVSEPQALATFERESCSAPRSWSNGPGDRYDRHAHDFHKVLFCLSGSIVFHTDEGDLELSAGDRLDLDPGTPHAATVGPNGCSCVEASGT
jgi:quercetin dioxygenase-like cupin family protein